MSVQNQEVKQEDLLKKALEVRKNVTTSNDEHNMELAAEVNGATYVNDSLSFTVTTTEQSLKSIEAPVILIIGGFDINNNYAPISDLLKEKVQAVIYLGQDSAKILKYCSFKESILFVSAISIEEAVKTAYYYAIPGDVVLFSPACASDKGFDYKSRGNEFKRFANQLIEKKD